MNLLLKKQNHVTINQYKIAVLFYDEFFKVIIYTHLDHKS